MNKKTFGIFAFIVIVSFFIFGYWGYLIIADDDDDYHQTATTQSSELNLFELN